MRSRLLMFLAGSMRSAGQCSGQHKDSAGVGWEPRAYTVEQEAFHP